MRFETPPGRQLQADFGQCLVSIGGERVRVHLAVLTLGYSRRLLVRAFRSEKQDHWLLTLEEGFRRWGRVPQEVLVDNACALVSQHDPEHNILVFAERLEEFARYWSEGNANACIDQGIDAYIATGRLPHGQPPVAQRGALPRDADAKTRMARKLRSKKGSAIYAQRKAIVEPVNGQIKEGRGLRRFLLRGLEKVNGEWHLITATHNLLQLFRHRRSQQQAQWTAAG